MMKKAYVKPIYEVEDFTAFSAVAAGCTRVHTGSDTKYEPQTVTCVVTGSEKIFQAGTSGCTVTADPNGSSFVTYNGTLYYIWSGPAGSGSGNLNNIYPILDAAHISYGQYGRVPGTNNTYYHAAPATATIQELYSFSY